MNFSLRHFLPVLMLTLAACTVPTLTPQTIGPAIGPEEEVFVATTRARNDVGDFSSMRGDQTSYLTVPVRFPTNYSPGDRAKIEKAPDPAEDFSVGAPVTMDRSGFRQSLTSAVAAEPRGSRDVTIYVHGYYNVFYSGVFRSAQLKRDFDLPGEVVHFAWPSRGSNTAYAYDRESVLYSRDSLEALIRDSVRVGADRVTIVAHSLGAMLVMETLRQIEISQPGWVHDNIDGLAFVAPDIDVEVFKSQAARFERLPEDFVIFVSNQDRVLMLASRLQGVKRRLGNTSDVEVTTEGNLTIVDVTSMTQDARSGHFVPATSPAAIQILRNSSAFRALFPREGLGQPIGGNVRLFQLSGN
ncbi:alpha/beta fold hydrolase [Maritimibacter sp. UBA3975]|uniref:alpha/beta hydrolase n=1 Tax=Maritimibacter sp. UBA3975 TaxID=1946833 RepID=UPI0025BED6EF|nr:alpha/beta fold hydrolase [Maritimibacter sp. UBA3975]